MSVASWEGSPAQDHAAVTPSDSTVLAFRALYIGSGGDVVVKSIGGTTVTYTSVPTGMLLRIAGTQVLAATTAMNIVALI